MRAWIIVIGASLWAASLYAQDLGPRNWKWGDGDERGQGNLMTSESILEALSHVKEGKIIELSHDVAEGAPAIPGIQTPYVLNMYRSAPRSVAMIQQAMGATKEIGINIERIEMTAHVSTHVDALGHATIGQEMYGGTVSGNGIADFGLTHGGIEKSPPFIARATLINVAAYKGVDILEGGYAIQPEEIEGALQKQGNTIEEGTIALIYTGYSKKFMKDPNYAASNPGIGLAAAKWLTRTAPFSVVTLAGNHEEWMLATMGDYSRHSWLLGADAFETVASYSREAEEQLREAVERAGPRLITDDVELPYRAFFDAVPSTHKRFFETLELFHQSEDALFVHAGIDPEAGAPGEQSARELTWGLCPDFPEAYRGPGKIVYGHHDNSVVDENGWPRPHVTAGLAYGIDSISTGVLSAIRMPDGEVFQSDRYLSRL